MDPYRNPYATWLGSPNCWGNRNGHSPMWVGPGADASWTVLHVTDCTEDQATGIFENATIQRSAHYQIPKRALLDCSDPDPRKWHPVAGTFDQYVDEGDAAWHSGNGDMNENSDGIEHERTQADLDNHNAFLPGQLLVSMWLVKDLAQRRNRPLDRNYVIGHGECQGVEGSVWGFARGKTSTGCPDDLPTDTILKGATMLAAGQDPRSLVGVNVAPLAAVAGTIEDYVKGVSVPGRVYQGGQLYLWPLGTPQVGDAVAMKPGVSLPVDNQYTYTAAIKVGGKWYDLIQTSNPLAAICDDDLDTGGTSPPDYRVVNPTPAPEPLPTPDPLPLPPSPHPLPVEPPIPVDPPLPSEGWLRALLRIIFRILGGAI